MPENLRLQFLSGKGQGKEAHSSPREHQIRTEMPLVQRNLAKLSYLLNE